MSVCGHFTHFALNNSLVDRVDALESWDLPTKEFKPPTNYWATVGARPTTFTYHEFEDVFLKSGGSLG